MSTKDKIVDEALAKDLQELGKTQFDVLYNLVRRQTRGILDLGADIVRHDENSEDDRTSFEKMRIAIEEIINANVANARDAKIRDEMILDDLGKLTNLVGKLTNKIEGIVTSAVQKTTSETFSAVADSIEALNIPNGTVKNTPVKTPEKTASIVHPILQPGIKDRLFGWLKIR